MKVIIIGAVAAGSKAAAKLKRLQPDWDITIYTQDTNVAYSECGLPYYLAGNFADAEKLIIRTPQDFRDKGVNVFIRHKVIKIFPELKEILIKNLETGDEFRQNYDKLIISTGARPFIPDIENVNLKNVFQLRSIEDGVAIKNQLLQSKRVAIIGGGYIGIELLEAFVNQGLTVILINIGEKIMSNFDADISTLIQKHILQQNLEQIKLINGDYPVKFQGEQKVEKIITHKGRVIKIDMVVISVGVVPNSEIASDCGIELGFKNTIKVNKRMETNIENIYACGDCVEKYNIVADAPCWIPLGSTANKEGRCAAINVSGGFDEFEGVLGSAVTKYFKFTMSMTGLNEKQAIEYGFEPLSVVVKEYDKAGYMPDVKNIVIKLIADKKTKRILGAQAIGMGDADKRINILSTALLSKMTPEDFFVADITYAPPFSTSIDPTLTATQKLIHKLNSLT